VASRLHQLPAAQATRDPEAVALWWQGQAISYGTLQERVQRLAARLRAETQPGDRVGILAWNCPHFIELIYATSRAGLILVPLNARLAPAELNYQLHHAGVGLLFADPALLEAVRAHPDWPREIVPVPLDDQFVEWLAREASAEAPDGPGQDSAWIIYTSGTTGRPKGAVLTHASLLAGLRSAALGRPVREGDRYYYPFPLFHVAAHNVLLQHQHGAAVVLARSFDPGQTLRDCRALGITTLSLAPTMIAMLLDHPDFDSAALNSVRTIGYGASHMPADLTRRLLAVSDVGLCQSYGMTELSGSVAFLTPEDHRRGCASPELLRSVGRPLSTAEIRLDTSTGTQDDCGEILVRSAQCMPGYWNDPAASAAALEEGWLHTGDVGRFDDDGYLYVIDRKKDMIITGGENVASREVEEVLREHPSVDDCAVIGLPDPRWGEMVCAVVVLRGETPDDSLDAHCRQSLAGYKTPTRWERVTGLPLNAAGKVDKRSLREALASSDAIVTGHD
jgi:acyl-CoA synthetase (AMP-forming)/AMP-acid ligase II